MPHDWSNIVELASRREHLRESHERQPCNRAESALENFDAIDEDHVRAIVSCLDYLYGETVKCDHRMAAHLIGAAAECLRQHVQPPDRKV